MVFLVLWGEYRVSLRGDFSSYTEGKWFYVEMKKSLWVTSVGVKYILSIVGFYGKYT